MPATQANVVKSPQITWISKSDPPDAFPDADSAFDVPDGLLAAGGDLSRDRLLYAYEHGIFPWYEEGQPILWWSPDPRCVIHPNAFRLSRRTMRHLRKSGFDVTFNRRFADIVAACANERAGQPGTWITTDMTAAYADLHDDGWAHSVEVWLDGDLAGGLYGLSIGKAFFGESMFSHESNASKAAMLVLCQALSRHQYTIFDCQVESPHLTSLGATLMPRSDFLRLLRSACASRDRTTDWPGARLQFGCSGASKGCSALQ